MSSSIICVIFAVAAVNASPHFLHHLFNKHITYDTNGFKGHHSGFGMFHGRPYLPPPPPPPPTLPPLPFHGPFYPQHYHYNHHHYHPTPENVHHGPQCHNDQNSNHGNGHPDMTTFNPFTVPSRPFNPMHPFDVSYSKPNQFGSSVPTQSSSSSYPVNQPFNPLSTAQPTFNVNTPVSALNPNTAATNLGNVQNSAKPNTAIAINQFNVNMQPQNGKATEI